MVYVSAQIVLTALVISPAIAAPFGVQYEDADARDFDDVEARIVPAVLTAGKVFNTLATSLSIGDVVSGFFKKKNPPPKRSFMDEGNLDMRSIEGDVDYLLVRDEDGSYNVYARTPAGLAKIGSLVRKVAQVFKNPKVVLPAVAAGGVAVGTAAGVAKSRRSLEQDGEIMLVRGEDGELYVRGFGGQAKIGSHRKSAVAAIKRNSRHSLHLVGVGNLHDASTMRGNNLRSLRARGFDDEILERMFYDDEAPFERDLDGLD